MARKPTQLKQLPHLAHLAGHAQTVRPRPRQTSDTHAAAAAAAAADAAPAPPDVLLPLDDVPLKGTLATCDICNRIRIRPLDT